MGVNMLREKIYELKNWKLAVHTTWNPGAENVMRIHLVPPRFLSGKIVPSVVILNGQEIVPVDITRKAKVSTFLYPYLSAIAPESMGRMYRSGVMVLFITPTLSFENPNPP
jgi:hypothetical protein